VFRMHWKNRIGFKACADAEHAARRASGVVLFRISFAADGAVIAVAPQSRGTMTPSGRLTQCVTAIISTWNLGARSPGSVEIPIHL